MKIEEEVLGPMGARRVWKFLSYNARLDCLRNITAPSFCVGYLCHKEQKVREITISFLSLNVFGIMFYRLQMGKRQNKFGNWKF